MIVHITDQAINQVESEVLVLHLFEERRPPRGTTGDIDWLFNGLLSRHLKQGRIRGNIDELVLLPCQKYLATNKILILGLGAPKSFQTKYLKSVWEKSTETLINFNLHHLTIALPSLSSEIRYPNGADLAQAMFGGLMEGIKKRGGKNSDFHIVLTSFDELRTKENKDSFRQYVSSIPGVQSIGF